MRREIRESGLWNVKEIDKFPLTDIQLDQLATLIALSRADQGPSDLRS